MVKKKRTNSKIKGKMISAKKKNRKEQLAKKKK